MGGRALYFMALFLLVLADCYPISLAARERKRCSSFSKNKLVRVAERWNGDMFKDTYLRPILKERVPGTPGNKEVQEHITSSMENLGWHVEKDRFTASTPYGDKEFTNIVAVLNPDPSLQRMVFACHFDSKYFPPVAGQPPFIGMTDSAVPCAMLMELARSLNGSLWQAGGQDGSSTLAFFFFDGEEAFQDWSETDSLYGARHLAEKLSSTQTGREGEAVKDRTELDRIEVLILLDLIGAASPPLQFVNFGFDRNLKIYECLVKIEEQLRGRKLLIRRLEYFRKTQPYGSSGIEDDHIPFLRRNVPIVHMIGYPFPRVWHTRRDDESQIDYTSIQDLSNILRVFIAQNFGLQLTKK